MGQTFKSLYIRTHVSIIKVSPYVPSSKLPQLILQIFRISVIPWSTSTLFLYINLSMSTYTPTTNLCQSEIFRLLLPSLSPTYLLLTLSFNADFLWTHFLSGMILLDLDRFRLQLDVSI